MGYVNGAGIVGGTIVGSGNGDALVANPLSQFAATTSLQLKGVLSDETGSGAAVFATSPTLVTPVIGIATATHVKGSGSTPTIVAGAGAGTSPTVAVVGNDLSMQLQITTGSTPTGSNAVVATVTFATAFSGTPRVVFSPANALTSAIAVVSMVSMQGASTTTFTVTSGGTALTATTSYAWNVICME